MMKRIQPKWAVHVSVWCVVVLSVLACVWSDAALAAAPQVKTQGAGFLPHHAGRFRSDGAARRHAIRFRSIPWWKVCRRLKSRATCNAIFWKRPFKARSTRFLINTGSKLILIDTGAGVLYGDCCGKLLANLRSAGYQLEQVDEVLLTHLHKDHVGGIISNGAMTFPNAVVRTSQIEADYWLNPANKSKAPAFLSTFFDAAIASVTSYVAAGRFKPFSGDVELDPGIRAIALPGHTPGHTGYLVESEIERSAGCGVTSFMWRRSSCRTRRHRSNTTPTRPRPRRSARAATRSSSRRKNRLGLALFWRCETPFPTLVRRYLAWRCPRNWYAHQYTQKRWMLLDHLGTPKTKPPQAQGFTGFSRTSSDYFLVPREDSNNVIN